MPHPTALFALSILQCQRGLQISRVKILSATFEIKVAQRFVYPTLWWASCFLTKTIQAYHTLYICNQQLHQPTCAAKKTSAPSCVTSLLIKLCRPKYCAIYPQQNAESQNEKESVKNIGGGLPHPLVTGKVEGNSTAVASSIAYNNNNIRLLPNLSNCNTFPLRKVSRNFFKVSPNTSCAAADQRTQQRTLRHKTSAFALYSLSQ